MRLLFLTTYNVSLAREHFFTINVWNALRKFFVSIENSDICLATIFEKSDINHSQTQILFDHNCKYYNHFLPTTYSSTEKIQSITGFFKIISPTVIHSNMIELYDVQAAKFLNIPIVLTVHIGGFLCPRGGGNGFLKYNDTICNESVGQNCMRCCSEDLPFPSLSFLLEKIIPNKVKLSIWKRIKNKNIFYITPFISKAIAINERKRAIELFRHATIIAANYKLKQIFALNGLTENVVVIPHGVEQRRVLPYPSVDGPVKFYFLGRIQYSKGLHHILKAFTGIDHSLYELHIIGDAEKSGVCKRYFHKVEKLFNGLNVYYHGRISNKDIESVICDMHVMIHSTFCLEVYGIAIAESLSLGRPVLATKCGGAEMQIKDGENGWLVGANDVDALRQKILYILKNKRILLSLHEHCKLPHSLADYVQRLYGIYSRF